MRTLLRPWTNRAAAVIERRIADARVHAAAGELPTAVRRLAELHGSLTQHVSDGRAAFYRQAFRQHPIDPDVHQLGLGPDHHGELAARSAQILGRHYRDELLDLVSEAQASLTSAALADETGLHDGSFLASWQQQHRNRLAAVTAAQLSNAQIAIFEAVGQILVKPELR